MQFRLIQNYSFFAFLVGSSLFSYSYPGYALTEITPSLLLQHSFVDNKSADLDESGQITKIAPGISLTYSQARLDLTLDYAYNILINSGVEAEDREEQSLSFLTSLNHIPNRWNSQLSASISQQSVDTNGIQIVNDLFTSSNTAELRVIGLGTTYQGFMGQNIRYQSGLNTDLADYENRDETQSISLNFGINNSSSAEQLTWNADIDSTKLEASGEDEQITTLQLGLNYRLSSKYSVFLSADKTDTDNDNLTDTNTVVGFRWQPNKNTSFKIGVGKRGDDTTYTLDSLYTRKRLTFTANYSENVTNARALALEEIVNPSGLITTNQIISITPTLVKRGDIALALNGRRTSLTLSYFNQIKNVDDIDSEEEKSEGTSLEVSRTLSRFSSVQLDISTRDIETSEGNKVDDIKLSYIRQWTQNVDFTADIRKTKQSSDVSANEYDQKSISFSLKAFF